MAMLLVISVVTATSVRAQSSNSPIVVESVVLRLMAEAEVPAQESGVLTSVAVREGQQVKRGEVLAQIDDRVARMAQRAAELARDEARAKADNDVKIRFAKKSLEVAEAELRRSTESIERFAKSVSQSQLDVERLTVEKSRLEGEQAEHEAALDALEMKRKENELAAAKLDVARRQIVAPFDGVVVQIFVRLGEWVEPGQKAMRIVNVEKLKAEGFVDAREASSELLGQPVRLSVALADDPAAAFGGKVSFVSPEVDPITGQVRIWAEIDNRDGRLRPGQPVKMTIGR
jgi:macrolide-specific efflux system membrane fusion protein